MKCINCGNENNENNNFCSNCGAKIEPIQNELKKDNQNNPITESDNINKKAIPKLSWYSLGFLGMQLLCFICQFSGLLYKYVYSKLLFIFEFPYIIVSLILAIISRVKNKDKMSLVLIIVGAVVIFVAIIVIILAVLVVASVINACLSPNTPLNNDINDFIDGCRSIG